MQSNNFVVLAIISEPVEVVIFFFVRRNAFSKLDCNYLK